MTWLIYISANLIFLCSTINKFETGEVLLAETVQYICKIKKKLNYLSEFTAQVSQNNNNKELFSFLICK